MFGMDIVKKLLGGGQSAPGLNVGIGTSFICQLIGHAFRTRVPAWVPEWGCSYCLGQGNVPTRPDSGGRLSAAKCERCNGTGIDPDKKGEVPEDWGTKACKKKMKQEAKRKKKGLEPEATTEEAPGGPKTYLEMIEAYADKISWLAAIVGWWRSVRGTEEPENQEASDEPVRGGVKWGWGDGPNQEHKLPEKKQKITVARPSCRRCGAPNPGFSEKTPEVGLLGKALRWLF